jgi:hypothetical protein
MTTSALLLLKGGSQFMDRTRESSLGESSLRRRSGLLWVNAAEGHPLRQRRSFRQSQCLVQPLQAIGLVAPPRHRHRAHQARPPAAERPPRAHASTLKKEATRPAAANSLQQQGRFDAFVHAFNTERPHEALAMKCPAKLYGASPRRYDSLPELSYPFHGRDVLVTACGRICLHRKKMNISTVLAGQRLGIKEVDEGIWLALQPLRSRILRPGADNPATPRQPVRPEVVTHVLGTFCHPCLRAGHT